MFKFGVMLTTAHIPPVPQREVIETTLAGAVAAEDLGFESAWVLEHHFTSYGLNPSCLNLANFLLGRTRRIKVGSAIVVVPLYHPVRIAEDVAMLDQLSNGRFELGIGRGHFYMDFKIFNVDQSKNHLMMPHWMDAIRRAWTTGRTSMDNEFLKFEEVTVFPETFTKPHPPISVAANSPSTIEWAAKNGFSMLLPSYQEDEFLASAAELWAETAAAHGHDPNKANHTLTGVCVIGDDKIMELACNNLEKYEKLHEKALGLGRPEVDSLPNYERHFRELDEFIKRKEWEPEQRVKRVLARNLAGEPEEVIAQLQRKIDLTGAKRMMASFEAVVERPLVIQQMERFMAEVAPHIRAAGERRAA
jgi:alkanal monooxygenase alpha chain